MSQKNYTRDVSILNDILINIDKIEKNVVKRFSIRSAKDLLLDESAIDLSSFYISQIGELAKRLTDDTLNALDIGTVNLKTLAKMRDRVNHVYNTMNKSFISSVVFYLLNPKNIKEIKNRRDYCYKNKKS